MTTHENLVELDTEMLSTDPQAMTRLCIKLRELFAADFALVTSLRVSESDRLYVRGISSRADVEQME